VLPSFDELFNDHDNDPQATASALQVMAQAGSVADKDQRRFAFLVNHIIGEKQGQWLLAFEILEKTVVDSSELPCKVHRAVAALAVGKPLQALRLIQDIAQAAECSYLAADAAVKLTVLQFSAADEPVLRLAEIFNGLLGVLKGSTGQLGKLSTFVAASLNNVTSRLMDAQEVDIDAAVYQQALTDGAQICRLIWQVVGNWMNHERADYLVALCANRLQAFEVAATAARAGLQTIKDNGSEDVDQAFLLLELARAYTGLGQTEPSQSARAQALSLAEAFDPELRVWFDSRAKF
jgi:hypothetical protein